jgi:hypothetical protein
MNGEPKRWLDDDAAPAGVHELLRGSRRAEPIDAGARTRIGRRVARLSILPVSLLTWLGAKSALAALGAAAGIATMGVATAVVFVTREQPESPQPVPAVRPAKRAPKPLAPPVREPVTPPEVAAPPVVSAPEPARSAAPTPSVAEPPATTGGLAEETAFLERARRTLQKDPEFALLLVREHGVRFPHGKLGAERSLIEIEALYRSGHHTEARALARQKLATSSNDLYAERIRALLARMDEAH